MEIAIINWWGGAIWIRVVRMLIEWSILSGNCLIITNNWGSLNWIFAGSLKRWNVIIEIRKRKELIALNVCELEGVIIEWERKSCKGESWAWEFNV